MRALLQGSGVLAVAIAVMNVSTYGFQVVAARLLGPEQYGGVASLMALLLVLSVVPLGLQATAARRIAATPGHVGQIEHVVLSVTHRAALALGLVMLVLAPVVWQVLRLESIIPALLLAVAAVPLTVQGGQAGILQGERRWMALGVLYAAVGLPRLVLGTVFMLLGRTEGETMAMAGVALAMFAPMVVGWLALRTGREPWEHHEANALRPVLTETLHGSVALLAFFVLSNADILVARTVLDETDAGLYAGGLILTKAVLFLPQFVVVVAFPSMSTPSERRQALTRSLLTVLALGLGCTIGAVVLADVAMIFIGGDEYAAVRPELWVFALLGTILAALQLLTYSVLARQGRRSAYLIWLAVVVMLALAVVVSTLDGMVAVVTTVDAVLFALLLVLSLRQMGSEAPQPQ